MGPITDDVIRSVFSENAARAGFAYQAQGRVREMRASDDGRLIEGHVVGDGRNVYRQTIRLNTAMTGRLLISGSCTCPVGRNCKHVAAVLFACQEQHDDPTPQVDPAQAKAEPRPAELAPEVEAWLRSLQAADVIETEEYPPAIRKRLLYVLRQTASFADRPGRATLDLESVELRRDGVLAGPGRRTGVQELTRGSQALKFLRPSDKAILRRLGRQNAETDEDFLDTLGEIAATGRGRWASCDGPALHIGPAMQAKVTWRLDEEGRQRPDLDLPAPRTLLRLAAPWYADPTNGAIGPVETGMPMRLVRAMLAAPWLPPEAAERVRQELPRRLPRQALPAPQNVAPPEPLRAKLQPQLRLITGTLPFDPARLLSPGRYSSAFHQVTTGVPLARLSWVYGPVTLAATSARDVMLHDGRLIRVMRNKTAERKASDTLQDAGFVVLGSQHGLHAQHAHVGDLLLADDADTEGWIDFMLHELPQLREAGWLVEMAEDFPFRMASADGDIGFDLTDGPPESSGIDWFDFGLGVMVEGQRVNLVRPLLQLIATSPQLLTPADSETEDELPLLLRLPDGRLLPLPLAKLRPILAPLLELFSGGEYDESRGTLRLSRRSIADLALLEAASGGMAWSGGEAFRALGRQLRETGGIPHCPPPAQLQAQLRPYQQRGLDWLQFLRAAGLGGVLADDMGLGKTVQTLAHIVAEQEAGRLTHPALVICPTSLVPNWRTEAARFAPSLRTLVLHGPERSGLFADIGAHDLVVTTYPLLARDHEELRAQEWHVMVLDEAQTIKNPLATTSKLARTLRAGQRLCLSGTPLQNHLGELWALFDFLMPGLLGDRHSFGKSYRAPIEKAGDVARQDLLVRRVSPFLLRRTKAEVAADLPPKTEITEQIELGEAQQAIYEGIRLAMHRRVQQAIAKRGLASSGIIILDALLKMRQACCDPRLLKLATAKAANAGSAKLERLMDMLPPLIEEGRRILVFSQFTSMLALIEAELTREGLGYVMLTGETRDRSEPVRKFQAGEVPIFLISLKAGGVGLNLTAADTVIHYDPWWNPAAENQATDRAHRIGQQRAVFVHRLITLGTIEEKMEQLKARKQALVDGILNAGAGSTLALSEADVAALFGPMPR